jgi:hypothetical protein
MIEKLATRSPVGKIENTYKSYPGEMALHAIEMKIEIMKGNPLL